jgi:outer membrane protein TolC
MTGLSYSEELILSDSLNTAGNEAENIVFDENAINERPEIKILGSSVEIARSGVKIMQSRFLPNIGLTAGYTFMNPNPYNGLAEEFGSDYNIGVAVNIPVFHFGDRKHTLNAAKYEQESAELKLQETKELLILQLHQAAYRHTESVTKTRLAELSLEQAARNLEYTKDNFSEGRLKTTELLEAQLLWEKAYSELIDARTEQQLSASNLKKVTAKY